MSSSTELSAGRAGALLLLTLLTALSGCGAMFFDRWKMEPREARGWLRMVAPRGLDLFAGRENDDWVSIVLGRQDTWSLGPQTALPVRMEITLLAPGKAASLLTKATHGFDQCSPPHWTAQYTAAGVNWREGECLYAANAKEAEAWIVDGIHESRGIRLTFRAIRKERSLEQTRQIARATLESVERLPGFAAAFPSSEQERAAATARRAQLIGLLQSLGWPELPPNQAIEKDGFIAWLSGGEELDFAIGFALGSIPIAVPPIGDTMPGRFTTNGLSLRHETDLFWFVRRADGWQPHASHPSYFVPEPIRKALEPQFRDEARAWFFAFQGVRLRDAEGWDASRLRTWIENMPTLRKAFSAGEFITP